MNIHKVIDMLVYLQARQIEYKDKLEEEWELFQKTMKEEHQVSFTVVNHIPTTNDILI